MTYEYCIIYVDASYTIHLDKRSHTGGAMSFVREVVHRKSSKQKLNTKSSTKSEVVRVSNYIPCNMSLSNFLKEQGYELIETFVYQDSQSAIKMDNSGWESCEKKSRHINVRYFFIKDLVDKNFLKSSIVQQNRCLQDFFTKPLQGEIFHMLLAVAMDWEPI